MVAIMQPTARPSAPRCPLLNLTLAVEVGVLSALEGLPHGPSQTRISAALSWQTRTTESGRSDDDHMHSSQHGRFAAGSGSTNGSSPQRRQGTGTRRSASHGGHANNNANATTRSLASNGSYGIPKVQQLLQQQQSGGSKGGPTTAAFPARGSQRGFPTPPPSSSALVYDSSSSAAFHRDNALSSSCPAKMKHYSELNIGIGGDSNKKDSSTRTTITTTHRYCSLRLLLILQSLLVAVAFAVMIGVSDRVAGDMAETLVRSGVRAELIYATEQIPPAASSTRRRAANTINGSSIVNADATDGGREAIPHPPHASSSLRSRRGTTISLKLQLALQSLLIIGAFVAMIVVADVVSTNMATDLIRTGVRSSLDYAATQIDAPVSGILSCSTARSDALMSFFWGDGMLGPMACGTNASKSLKSNISKGLVAA